MNPVGASDMYFDAVVNERIRNSYVREPKYSGEIDFVINKYKFIVDFKQSKGKKRLRWWEELEEDKFGKLRPSQKHNYIVGCDISLGTGTSNSTAGILDVNTGELVGLWACADTTPEDFADQVVALCYWVGGNYGPPFLIWENNGGHGKNFGRRVLKRGYLFVYVSKTEDTKTRKRRNKYGWTNKRDTKDDILTSLLIALREGLKSNPSNTFLRIFDENLVEELDDYIYYDSGEIGCSEQQDLSTGARARHGDRVVATALCVLGMKDQPRAALKARINYPFGSFGQRFQQWKKEQAEIKRKFRKYLY